MSRVLLVCLAGAAGTALRYAVAFWAMPRLTSAVPYPTIFVNLTGSFAIALVMHAAPALGWPPTLRAAVTVGLLGGFTTYSTFNYETMRLLETGATAAAGVNVVVTLAGGIAAGWLGLAAARLMVGP